LAGLCTNSVPPDVLADGGRAATVYARPHLPQGAPTSPALANLCAFRLDCRLAALARSADARYTRYADDLAFSGGEELERSARRFQILVCRVALEEGFEVNPRKSRFMRPGVRQHLAGVVVNVRPNVGRAEYDRLKATLTNCLRHGPDSQNRDRHADFRASLAGRITHVARLNAARGGKLRRLFDRIPWPDAGAAGACENPPNSV
jgi:RNA-directed DNA polymerase